MGRVDYGDAGAAADFFLHAGGGFLDVGSAEAAEVVSGLETFPPGVAIHVREGLDVGRCDEEVDGLRLVDPLLAARGGVDEVFILDAEGGGVFVAEVLWHALDGVELAVEVFDLVEHLGGPEVALLEVAHELAVEHDEVAGEVALHEEVLVGGLDAGRGAHDIGDRGGGRDGQHVGVTHAVLGDLFAERFPVHLTSAGHVDFFAALFFEQVESVLWHEAAVPLGAFVAAVSALLGGELGGGFEGVVGDGFHELVVEIDGGLGSEGDVLLIEGVLQTHDAETDGAVAAVGCSGGLCWVEVDVDDIIEGTDRDLDGVAELFVIEVAIGIEVRVEHNGAEITDSGLIGAGVERDLGAEIGAMDDAAVVLRAADVARIFKGDPWVAGLEDHTEHDFPEVNRGTLLPEDFAALGHGFVFAVALFEGLTVELVEIRCLVGAEECPIGTGFHPLHKEVGNPVGRVHVVRAATVVTGVLTQFEKIVEVVVPSFEVGAAGAAALAALVDGDELVVVQLEEGNHALRLTVGAFDKAAGAANSSPRATESPSPLGEEGVVGDAAVHDRLDAIIDLVKVAGRELRVEGAGVEECGRGGTEAAALVEIVEAEGVAFAVFLFVMEEAHGNADPEVLRDFEAAVLLGGLIDDEVAVIHGLHAEVVEVEVGGGIERGRYLIQIVIEELGIDAFDLDGALKVGLETAAVGFFEIVDPIADDLPVEDFFVNVGKEDTAGKAGEVGILLHHGLGVENDGLLKVGALHLGIERAAELFLNLAGVDIEVEANAGVVDPALEVDAVPESILTVDLGDDDHGLLLRLIDKGDALILADAGAVGAVEDVRLGHLEMALAHHLLLDGVLHVFDVDEGLAAYIETVGHGAGDLDGRIGIHVQREKGLTHGDLDLGLAPRHDLAVATDQADGNRLALGDGHGLVAPEHEAAGDIVRIVFNERFFDQKVDIVGGELEGAALFDLSGKHGADVLGHTGDELTVHFGEDVFFLAGEQQVGQGVANGVGNLGEVEIALGAFGLDLDFWAVEAVVAQHGAPIEAWFLFFGSGGVAFELKIFFE